MIGAVRATTGCPGIPPCQGRDFLKPNLRPLLVGRAAIIGSRAACGFFKGLYLRSFKRIAGGPFNGEQSEYSRVRTRGRKTVRVSPLNLGDWPPESVSARNTSSACRVYRLIKALYH